MQLMLALYRCGRQAEALQAYVRTRRALVDGLGIEPSAPLQLLERRILNQDLELDAPARASLPARVSSTAPAERKLVTVVFADLGASLPPTGDPERVAAFVADVREAAAVALESAGATVEHGVADAVLAVFESTPAQADHAIRATQGALALLEALRERFGSAVAPRVGVESGEIVLQPRRYAAGEPVMAAGALLRRARPGEVLAGSRAAAAARVVVAVRATARGFLVTGKRPPPTSGQRKK